MEQLMNNIQQDSHLPTVLMPVQKEPSNSKPFIEANTVEVKFQEIRDEHIIPVFVKDNEPLISHAEFIDATLELTTELYSGEDIRLPTVRVSHPVKGRIPEAKDKPAHLLQEWEKTLYYERMMFAVEIPSIQDEIDGNSLSLTIGGVKSYNLDNLYSRSKCDQHFKVFIGFQNKVCTNLCVWTDGYMGDIKVKSVGQLRAAIKTLLEGYNKNFQLFHLKQFAHIIGRCRMYNHLPAEQKANLPALLLGDQQINTVVRDFYRDNSFSRDRNGNINLWRLYNLLTGANKSTYIDSFLERSINAFDLVESIRNCIEERSESWYLN
jgi:hypothetical protein